MKVSTLLTDNLDKLQFGDIILETDDKRLSKLGWFIQTILRQPYCHAAMYLGDGKILEALYDGVQVSDINTLEGTKFTILRLSSELSNHDVLRMSRSANRVIGLPYDFGSAFRMGFFSFLKRFGVCKKSWKLTADPLDDKDRFFCFQLVAWIYDEFNLMNTHWTRADGIDFMRSNRLELVMSDYSAVEISKQAGAK